MTDEKGKIISLTDVLENKIIKEKELQFYYEQLEEIQRKIAFLETDLSLTKQIIALIEKEKIVEVDTSVPLVGNDETDKPPIEWSAIRKYASEIRVKNMVSSGAEKDASARVVCDCAL